MITYILLSSQIYCQNPPFSVPEYLPQLPEVAGFKRYGDIPIGEYTGTPDIRIPLYTVKQGTLELPITLSYHASGIKVEQEASWVGLGWDLIAGASIAMEPVGELDLQGTAPDVYDPIYWNDFNAFIANWRPHYSPDYSSPEFLTSSRFGPEDISMWRTCSNPNYISIFQQALLGNGERDVYSGNLPNGKNFKFIVHPVTCTPIPVGKADNLLIRYGDDYVIVMDSDGTSYRFEKADFFTTRYALSYRLTSITSKEGHSIQLTYTTVNEHSLPSIHESYTFNRPPGATYMPQRFYSNMTSRRVSYLSKIESDTELITFEMGSRTDRSPGTSGRLNQIRIRNKLTQKDLFYYDLSHDYFTGVKKGGDFLSMEESGFQETLISEDARKKRLRLLSLTKRDMTHNAAETYTFTYNETVPLPYKTSFARDYWGFYNDEENSSTLSFRKHTLLPNTDSRFAGIFPSVEDYPAPGAIRNSSKTYITAGILKSITYPTGGKVEFEFEPHTFGNHKILSTEAIDSYNSVSRKNVSNYTVEGKNMSEVFTIPFRQTVTLRIQVFLGNYTACDLQDSGASIIPIPPIPGGGGPIMSLKVTYEDCINQNPGTMIDRSGTITLNPGQYVISCGMTKPIEYNGYHPLNLIEASATYRLTEFDPNAWPSIGAGVRIKTITKKDKDNSILETVKYTYEDLSGRSSGKLLSPLDFVKSRNIIYITRNIEETGESYQFQPYGITTVSSSSVGVHPGSGYNTPVGYSRVICEKYSNSGNSGKTISEFSNQAGEKIGYDMIEFAPHNNGALIKQQIYNSDNELLKQNLYEYEINDINKTMLNIKAEDSYYNITPIDCHDSPPTGDFGYIWYEASKDFIPRLSISLYPSVSYWADLKSSSETVYNNGFPVTSNTTYTYNSRHQPISITGSTSQPDKTFKETFIYKAESDTDMKARNILSPLSFYSRTLGNSITSITNQYAGWQEKFVLLSTEEQSGSTDKRKVTYKYDAKYNPSEVTYQNEISDVYLWGYNYNYIIAHIKNATYATVQSRMGNNLTTLCSANTPNITLLNSLRTLFPESAVTTWLYEPSFGVVQQIDPSGITTYYEYDSFGRLKQAKDTNGKVIEQYDYHYKP